MKTNSLTLASICIATIMTLLVGCSKTLEQEKIPQQSQLNAQNNSSTNLTCLSWSPCVNGTQRRECRLAGNEIEEKRFCNNT